MLFMDILCYILPILSLCKADNIGEPIKIHDCGTPGAVQMVYVNPCPKEPCELEKGTNAKLALTFKTSNTVSAVKAEAFAIIAGASIAYTLPQPDGCKDSGLTCPLNLGIYNYTTSLTIPGIAPAGIRCLVRFKLLDQDDKPFVCFEFPVTITQ